jgi:hypothetical protein
LLRGLVLKAELFLAKCNYLREIGFLHLPSIL